MKLRRTVERLERDLSNVQKSTGAAVSIYVKRVLQAVVDSL